MNEVNFYLADYREVKMLVEDEEKAYCYWRYTRESNYALENCASDVTMFSYSGYPSMKYCPYCGKRIRYR